LRHRPPIQRVMLRRSPMRRYRCHFPQRASARNPCLSCWKALSPTVVDRPSPSWVHRPSKLRGAAMLHQRAAERHAPAKPYAEKLHGMAKQLQGRPSSYSSNSDFRRGSDAGASLFVRTMMRATRRSFASQLGRTKYRTRWLCVGIQSGNARRCASVARSPQLRVNVFAGPGAPAPHLVPTNSACVARAARIDALHEGRTSLSARRFSGFDPAKTSACR
jgi:hypothetical protein